MEFPVYRNDTTIVDILNFDTWQGVFIFCSKFFIFIHSLKGKILPLFYYLLMIISCFISFMVCYNLANDNPSGLWVG